MGGLWLVKKVRDRVWVSANLSTKLTGVFEKLLDLLAECFQITDLPFRSLDALFQRMQFFSGHIRGLLSRRHQSHTP